MLLRAYKRFRQGLVVLPLLAALLFLTACGLGELPADKQNYIGYWRAANSALNIDAEAYVRYRRADGSYSSSIAAPIQEFKGDDFIVGALGIDTQFVVNEPPTTLTDGLVVMTVDGIRYVRMDNYDGFLDTE